MEGRVQRRGYEGDFGLGGGGGGEAWNIYIYQLRGNFGLETKEGCSKLDF